MNTRVVIIVGSVVGALLVVVIIALFVLIGQLQNQSTEEAYKDCMARHGFAADEPPEQVSDDELDAWLDGALEAAESCGR